MEYLRFDIKKNIKEYLIIPDSDIIDYKEKIVEEIKPLLVELAKFSILQFFIDNRNKYITDDEKKGKWVYNSGENPQFGLLDIFLGIGYDTINYKSHKTSLLENIHHFLKRYRITIENFFSMFDSLYSICNFEYNPNQSFYKGSNGYINVRKAYEFFHNTIKYEEESYRKFIIREINGEY